MKAVEITKPFEINIIEKEMPAKKDGEALLKIKYAGICGADVASYTGNQPFTTYPRIPGHEFSAEIVEIGENDKGLKPGDTVTANPYFNCTHCYPCKKRLVNACVDNQTMGVQRDGAYCEYITMPVSRLISGKGLDAKTLALIEPFAISRHALSRCEIKKGDKLFIAGAGPIGIFALIAAKAMGADVLICDMLESRLKLARSFGADATVNVKTKSLTDACSTFTQGNGFDVCVEACGAPETFLSCLENASHGANVILIGNGKKETTFVHSLILKKELNIYGSRNAFTKDFEALIDMVKSTGLDVLRIVSGVYSIDDAPKAFDALAHNDGSLAKILIKF